MSQPTTTVIAEQAVLPGRLDYAPASVDIADGKIVAVRSGLEPAPGAHVIRVPKGKVLLPGLIE
jgi:imidazolonepropionase-like amidohydrolase